MYEVATREQSIADAWDAPVGHYPDGSPKYRLMPPDPYASHVQLSIEFIDRSSKNVTAPVPSSIGVAYVNIDKVTERPDEIVGIALDRSIGIPEVDRLLIGDRSHE